MLVHIVLLPFYVFLLLAQGALLVARFVGVVLWEIMRDRSPRARVAEAGFDPRRQPGESIAAHVARLRA